MGREERGGEGRGNRMIDNLFKMVHSIHSCNPLVRLATQSFLSFPREQGMDNSVGKIEIICRKGQSRPSDISE